ncbi:MAG: potassium channel family protein [Verrucomicrobiota bacterium]
MANLPKHRCLPLLVVVLAMIVFSPLMTPGSGVRILFGLIWAVVFGVASYFVFPTRKWLLRYVVMVVLLVTIRSLEPALDYPVWAAGTSAVLTILITSAALIGLVQHALFAKVRTEFDRTLAAIAGYFLIALLWARFYELITLVDPQTFIGRNGPIVGPTEDTILYFSLISLTTVGFGDVTAINPYARLLAGMEGAVGTLYIAVVIASLIGRLLAKTK